MILGTDNFILINLALRVGYQVHMLCSNIYRFVTLGSLV